MNNHILLPLAQLADQVTLLFEGLVLSTGNGQESADLISIKS